MQFKDIQDIIEKIENPINRESILRERQEYKKNYLHITGIGLNKHIEKVQGLESDKLKKLRALMAKPSTKSIMHEALLPIEKVFTATGGSNWLGLEGKEEQNLQNVLMNVKSGVSIKTYMQNYWKTLINLEPASIAFVEITKKEDSLTPKPYITHKSLNEIYDISFSGINVDYVIFEPIKYENKEAYRVVDDEHDFTVLKENLNGGKKYLIDEENSIKHPFSILPALSYSSNINIINNLKKSYIEQSIPLADEYLFDFTVYTIYKHKLGFPYVAQYPSLCPDCMGTGSINAKACKRCNGKKQVVSRDVSDIIVMPMPKKDDIVINNIAHYVQPDLGTWSKYEETLELFRHNIIKSIWGDKSVSEAEKPQTAFEIFVNKDSENNKLNDISANAEQFHNKIVYLFGNFYSKNYQGPFIKYGNKFMPKTTNELYNEYYEALSKKAANHELDRKYLNAIKDEFKNDQKSLDKAIKLFRLEPYPHISLSEVLPLKPTELEYQIKKRFQVYVSRIEEIKPIHLLEDKEIENMLTKFANDDLKNQSPVLQSNEIPSV